MHKYFNKYDIILIITMALCALAAWAVPALLGSRGNSVYVYVDGTLKGEYRLSEDNCIDIEGYNGGNNVLVIEDGKAYMKEASCPDRLCIHQGRISREGQQLVCLPNRVLVKIEGKDGGEYDAITN